MPRVGVCKARWRLIVATLAIVASAAALGAERAGGSSGGGEPLPVYAASLTQQGQQLMWQVELATTFSPGALAKEGRALCLLIEPIEAGSVAGRVCVSGPDHGSPTPRLLYTPLTGGSGAVRLVAATVTRSSARELTASFMPGAVGLSYAPLRWQVISSLQARACLPPAQAPAGCFVMFPVKPPLLRLHEPRLVGCIASGPTWVFQGPKRARDIALTFDDGPWYDTPRILALLEREHVVATFFQIGDQISQYAEHGLDRRMLRDGDMIGDHTWSHRGNIAAGGSYAVSQISMAAAAIRRATGGFQPCLFRSPYGNVAPRLLRTARALGFTTIQWDVDPRDWALPGTAAIYDNVVSNARSGAIVIQHDGGGNRSETLAALPLEIHRLRREGYRFVTVTQLLGYRLLYR